MYTLPQCHRSMRYGWEAQAVKVVVRYLLTLWRAQGPQAIRQAAFKGAAALLASVRVLEWLMLRSSCFMTRALCIK